MNAYVVSFALACAWAAVHAEEYPIGCWTFMTQERSRPVEQVVKDWKDLGVTHPMSPVFGEGSDKAVMRHMLDLCEREGLHLIVHDERVHLLGAIRAKIGKDDSAYRSNVVAAAADWGGHPAFAGFQQLLHGYDCHLMFSFLFLFYSSGRVSPSAKPFFSENGHMGKVGARAKCLDIISKAAGNCKRFTEKNSPVFSIFLIII
ncbi:MAG: hypothetical protein IJI06_06395 [Oscillospiraceae bacterium]|nr:hypothetical protein [Oscillospiraceae bacterium]